MNDLKWMIRKQILKRLAAGAAGVVLGTSFMVAMGGWPWESGGVPMVFDEDDHAYLVEDGESLGDAMAQVVENDESWGNLGRPQLEAYIEATRGSGMMFHAHQLERGHQLAGQEEYGQEHPGDAAGHCYNDSLSEDKVPPEGVTACACYKATGCDPKATESNTCKRHCRKDKCDCCAI